MRRNTRTKTSYKAHTLLAHSLDPSLRFDVLKASEDVTYKGTGRNIFRSEAPPPPMPTPIAAGSRTEGSAASTTAAAN